MTTYHMIDGERLIWAAVFAAGYIAAQEQRSRGLGLVSVTNCIETACDAVLEARCAHAEQIEVWGEDDQVYRMLAQMTIRDDT